MVVLCAAAECRVPGKKESTAVKLKTESGCLIIVVVVVVVVIIIIIRYCRDNVDDAVMMTQSL